MKILISKEDQEALKRGGENRAIAAKYNITYSALKYAAEKAGLWKRRGRGRIAKDEISFSSE